nr:HPr family phosphocarrier protein [Clostridium sp. Marseille-P2415]
MKSFVYVIKDENGIHARPAGLLVKEAKKYDSKIMIKGNGKSTDATELMEIMAMDIKCNDTVEVEVTGADEAFVCAKMERFFETEL